MNSFTRVLVGSLLSLVLAAPAGAQCPGDVNANNIVDVDDLVIVILNWGCTVPPGPCPGDANGSGVVNVDDLVVVILNWGTCGPINGACCIAGQCSLLPQATCLSSGGTFLGNPSCSGLNCPIANDECSGALVLNSSISPAAPVANIGSNVGATNGTVPTPTCITFNGVMTRDVWFKHTVPTTPPTMTGHILRLQLCNTPNPFSDTVMAVYNGTCGALNMIACNDSACGVNGLRSTVETPVIPAGSTVYIRVGSWGLSGSNQGSFTLESQIVELTDDVCQGAQTIAIGGSASGQLLGATLDPAPVCQSVDAGRARWYQVTGNGTTLTASTCLSPSDVYNGILTVYCGGTFGCVALNCVAATNANQGVPQPKSCPAFQGETVSWCSVNGQKYWIGVGVVLTGLPGGINGQYTLTLTSNGTPCTPSPVVDCNAGSPPANDECGSASTAIVGNNNFNNAIATPQGLGAGTVCGQPWSKDVWLNYTSANGGLVTLSITSNPVFDSMAEVYTGNCTVMTAIACEDDDATCVGCHPIFQFNAAAGTTYLIRITTWSNSGGGQGILSIVDP